MNPYKQLQLYGDNVMQRYRGKAPGDMPPHPYQEAEDALQRIQNHNESQCVVICGESGAGKTETTKIMLKYISKATAKSQQFQGGGVGADLTLGERMVGANPLLEALGNAKTLRNDNSSRFGKFTTYQFDAECRKITGGRISSFLLEKARVPYQSQGERNYHVFYQLLAGAPDTWRTQLSLKGPENFVYLRGGSGKAVDVPGLDDSLEFNATRDSMRFLDLHDQAQFEVFKVLSGVLHLGNVTFLPDGDVDASRVNDMAVLTTASALLGVNPQELAQDLVVNVLHLPGNMKSVTASHDVKAAAAARDALAKHIFDALFSEVVARVNRAFDRDSRPDATFFGVLDIFGFENLSPNGLEQLLINLSNERLQKMFNDVTFKQELAVYHEEGIDFNMSDFPDNQQCLDLIMKRPSGILPNLDSDCARGAAATDAAFAATGHKLHKANPFYAACGRATGWRNLDGSRTDANQFVVKHFAGPIVYTVGPIGDGKGTNSLWVSKNSDKLFDHLYHRLSSSSSELVSDLYPKRGAELLLHQAKTISATFTHSLNELMKTLTSASSRFVRCIKSNPNKCPRVIDSADVMRQLVCSGVIAALEVRNSGWPARMDFANFATHYHSLKLDLDLTGKSTAKEVAAALFTHPLVAPFVDRSKYKLGRTKVFMRADTGVLMQQIKQRLEDPCVRKLQRFVLATRGGIHAHVLQRTVQRFDELAQLAEEQGALDASSPLDKALEDAANTLKIAKASSGLKFMFGIAVERAVSDTEEAALKYQEVMAERERRGMLRAAHAAKVDALRGKLERINTDALQFEIPTGNLDQLWALANQALLDNRAWAEESFGAAAEDPQAEAARGEELEECALAVQLVQDKFHACKEAQEELELMRDHFSGDLAAAANQLKDVRVRVAETVREKEAVVQAIESASLALEAAKAMLEGHDVTNYEAVVRAATSAIADARTTIKVEEFSHAEGLKRREGHEVLALARQRFAETSTLVDTNVLRWTPAIQIALGACEDTLGLVNALESSGSAEEFVAMCERLDHYVATLGTTFHSEKARVEQQRRERAAESAKLAPAIEILHGLTTKLEVNSFTLPDESKVGHAIMDAAHECDLVKNYLDTTENVAVARGRVSAVVKQVAEAERLFNDAVRKQAAINKEVNAATKALEAAQRRLSGLVQQVEHAGPCVASLIEERVAEAEAMLADAKRVIRKGDHPGSHQAQGSHSSHTHGLVALVEQASQRVDEAEEALVRTRQRVATVDRARSRAKASLEASRQILSEGLTLATETQVINIPSVAEALAVADSTVRVAEARLEKPATAAWISGGELSGDSNAVREACLKVDEAEEKVLTEKRNLERMKRDVRSSEAALSAQADKVDLLRQACSELYLLADHEVSVCMEEAEDALDQANKMVSTFQPVEAVKHAIAELAHKISAAEEKMNESKLRKESGSKLWKDGQNSLDGVLTKLQAVVAMVDAVGHPVASLMEEVLFEATKAVNQATRLLRQGKDVTGFQAAVARSGTMVDQAELAANKVRARVDQASKNMTGAMQRLDSLNRTLTLCLETADSKGLVAKHATVKQLLKQAEGMVQVARQRVEGGVQLWIDDPLTASRLVDEAVDKVQLAEEAVDEAAQMKEKMDTQRDRATREVEVLNERFAAIRDEAAKIAGSSAPVQTALSLAESELEMAKQALHAGNLVSLVPTSDALLDADRVVSLELRRAEKRKLDLEFASLELPTLQRKLAAVGSMLDAAGPPVGVMVQAPVMEAQKAVADMERLVASGGGSAALVSAGGAANLAVLPALEEAAKKVAVAEELAISSIHKVNKVQADMALETHKLDLLQERFSLLCETVASFCAKSDHLRVQLEADWKDAVWWGSNENHAHTDGTPFGRSNMATISTVQVIAEAIGSAEAALVDARRRVELSVEAYLQAGPGMAAKAIGQATEKLNQAQALVEAQTAELEQEERERANAQARLEALTDRLSGMRALAQVHRVSSSSSVGESCRAAEHALDVVAQLLGAGNVAASPAAMEVAMRKVCVVQEVILAEAQRVERIAAEKAHGGKMLQGVQRDLEAVKSTVEVMGLKEGGHVGEALAKAERALKTAQLGLSTTAESGGGGGGGGSSIGKDVQRATQAVEDAERAVAQETAFQEELSRLKLKRSLAPQLSLIRDAQRQDLKTSAELWQRRKMEEELGRAAALLQGWGKPAGKQAMDPRLVERVESAEKAVAIAKQQVATGAIRTAQAAVQHAIARVKAVTSSAADVRFVHEGLALVNR
eukprot:CAMPEP_0172622184 /NCGR_PEP_ID=MMETSP1068-20121228/118582_1 /TAXON_ID=35684 /ORGANISM="Pseudopedinella elastica, Strain CCMP716" /LENGTH=2261 /DNA_ID=CAMNT_0013430271 /DNA_START=120 /DNA_END=6905 /DNA_ORIENTATION=+